MPLSKRTKIILLCVAAGVAGALILAGLVCYALADTDTDAPTPTVTDPPESFTAASDWPLSYTEDISKDVYPAGTPTGNWLASCEGDDRDDQFDAYMLCHTAVSGEETVYTYLIYYRHGTDGYTATPSVLAGDDGSRRIDLTYSPAAGQEDYALSYLTVTLPTGKEPRVRLLLDGDTVGHIVTVTESPIPAPPAA